MSTCLQGGIINKSISLSLSFFLLTHTHTHTHTDTHTHTHTHIHTHTHNHTHTHTHTHTHAHTHSVISPVLLFSLCLYCIHLSMSFSRALRPLDQSSHKEASAHA